MTISNRLPIRVNSFAARGISGINMLVVVLALSACESEQTALPLVGTLERDRIELIAEANERLVELFVAESEMVTEGQLLARLDGAVRAVELRIAEAQRDAAAERLAELARGPREERIRQARARLDGARENLTIQTNELDRIRRLVERDLASDSDLDRAYNAREAATSEVDALSATLDELLEGTTREELAQAEARLAEAEAGAELARLELERLEIRAPRNGRIDALPYKLGERPPAGATIIVMLVDQAPFARVYVPEELRARIVPDVAADISIDGVDATFTGRVRYVSADAAFTPYFSLTQRDRSRLAFMAEVTLNEAEARALPSGVPLEVDFSALR